MLTGKNPLRITTGQKQNCHNNIDYYKNLFGYYAEQGFWHFIKIQVALNKISAELNGYIESYP